MLKEDLKGCFPKCGKASLCENFCGADGYCCSGENPADPNSWLVKNGGNGDCPAEALTALRKREGGIEPGFMCVKEIIRENPGLGEKRWWTSDQTTPAKYTTYGGEHAVGPSSNLASKTGGMWHSQTTTGDRGVNIVFEYKGKVLRRFFFISFAESNNIQSLYSCAAFSEGRRHMGT